MPMPSANGIIMDKEYGSSPNNKKSIDELKRQVTKLKAELESERSKLKQVHRDKTSELKRIQENYEKERHKTIESVTKRLQNEHSVELRRIRESLNKEKENELRQVLKFKDEELKAFKQQIQEEKDRAKRSEDDLKKHLTEKTSKGSSSDVEKRLRDELSDTKEQKRKVDELYRLKCAADFEKAELIRRLKSEHEREVNELIRQSKREVAKEFQHLRSAEKALEEKNHELAFKDQLTRRLEAEKQEIRQRKTSGDLNISDSPLRSRLGSGTQESSFLESSPEADDVLSIRGNKDKERELRKKNAELQSKLDGLEKKCTILEKENASRHIGSPKTPSLVDEKVKKLKKRNSELVTIARQLEEKAKKLQEEKNAIMKQANSKADPSTEVEHMKRMFARQRAKDLAEHARIHMEKDNELDTLRKELAASKPDSKPDAQNDKIGELQSIIKRTTIEKLWLEKKLASVGSASPSPLSPTHSGMNDLEKRLETYTTEAKTSEKEAAKLKKELESKEKECEKLKQSADEMTLKCSKLEVERERFAVKCTMLHQKNVELGKRIKEIHQLEEEIKCLKENLQNVEEKKEFAEQECQKLKEKLEELALIKEDLKTSEKQRKELEIERKSSLNKLKDREEEIKQLHKIQEESTRAHHLAVTSLEQDLRSLEQKCADSDLRASNIKNELENLKSSQKRNNEHKATQTSKPTSPITMVTLRVKATDQGTNSKCHKSRDIQEEESKNEKDLKEESNGSETDILNTAASRIKQLAMSDSEEDSYSQTAPSDSPKVEPKVDGLEEDDIALLSQRINQAAMSDGSSVSAADNNYDSDASKDSNSMAEGDMADMEDNDITVSGIEEEERHDTRAYKRIQIRQKGDKTDNKHQEGIDERYLQQEQTVDEDVEADNLSVFIARYSYDPFQHSPNEYPDAELAFQAGDYLYVFGDIDDDGFYLGELMDGKRGLVPSNFVEKIADESDMTWMMNGEHQQTEEISSSDEEESLTDTDEHEGKSKNLVEKPPRVLKFSGKLHRNLRLNVEHIPDSNLGDIEEEDASTEASREVLRDSHDGLTSDDTDLEPSAIPSPQRVALSRQFSRSVMLNWKPADLPMDEIEGYAVYVNGELRVIIKGGNNTKALIEDVDPNETYRVSVRTVTTRGDESLDQEATLTIGKDASDAPSGVKVTDISPTSARLEWLPSNSSLSHEILVNGTPRQSVVPGTCQLTITDLNPNEHYRIHVRAKNPLITVNDDDFDKDSLAKTVEFTTQPPGLPDPPLDVHLVPMSSRSGPNTLEVSWIPVTITERGMSNGASVTGYKVYLNDFTVAEVTSPTADCVTVASWMIERAAQKTKNETLQLVVRTQSSHGESVSSNCLRIPLSTFNFKMNKLIGAQRMGIPIKPIHHSNDENEKDSGNEQGYKDDNHNLQYLKEQKNVINEKENKYNECNVNSGSLTEVIARNDDDKPVDKRKPPVPKARTKGKPVVWKMEHVEDDVTTSDSGDSNKGEHGGSTDNDDNEQVEICSPEPLEDKQPQLSREPPNKEIVQNNKEFEDLSQKNLADHSERKLSELSDIDIDELNDSLNSATSFKREKKKNQSKDKNKEPFVYPLDLSDSEVGNSSDDEPLSVIDEVEEIEEAVDEAIEESNGKGAAEEEEEKHMTESAQERSRSSHSTASGSFRSDDDVMDLLGEEPEDSQKRNVTTANITRTISPDEENAVSPTNNGQTSLQKYLVTSAETPVYRNQTYSDIEADQRELTTPKETSTPKTDRAHPAHNTIDSSNEQCQQGETMGEENYDSDTEGNRTYTINENEGFSRENQGEGEGEGEEEEIRIFIALYDYDPSTMSPNPDAEEDELTFNEGDLIKIYGDKDEDGFYWGELDGLTGFVPHNMVSEVQVDDEDLLYRTTSSLAESHNNQYPQNDIPDNAYLQYKTPRQQYQQPNKSPDDQQQQNKSPDNQYQELDVLNTQYPKAVINQPASDSGYDQEENSNQYQDETNDMPQNTSTDGYVLDEEDIGYEDPRNSTNYSLKPKKMVALFDYDPQLLSPNPDSEVELRFRAGDMIYVYGDMDEDGFYTGEQSGVRGLVPSNFLENVKEKALPSNEQENTLTSRENSDVSFVSQADTTYRLVLANS